MQTLHNDFITEASKGVTRPTFLLQLDYPSPSYLSSAGTLTVLSQTWTRTAMQIKSITEDRLSIDIDNTDLAQSALILNNTIDGLPVTLYVAYSDAPTDDEVITIWTGNITGAPAINLQSVTYEASGMDEGNSFMPRYRMTPPYFNHMPAAGSTLVWGDNTITF